MRVLVLLAALAIAWLAAALIGLLPASLPEWGRDPRAPAGLLVLLGLAMLVPRSNRKPGNLLAEILDLLLPW